MEEPVVMVGTDFSEVERTLCGPVSWRARVVVISLRGDTLVSGQSVESVPVSVLAEPLIEPWVG